MYLSYIKYFAVFKNPLYSSVFTSLSPSLLFKKRSAALKIIQWHIIATLGPFSTCFKHACLAEWESLQVKVQHNQRQCCTAPSRAWFNAVFVKCGTELVVGSSFAPPLSPLSFLLPYLIRTPLFPGLVFIFIWLPPISLHACMSFPFHLPFSLGLSPCHCQSFIVSRFLTSSLCFFFQATNLH